MKNLWIAWRVIGEGAARNFVVANQGFAAKISSSFGHPNGQHWKQI
jgi:hypothetical protein